LHTLACVLTTRYHFPVRRHSEHAYIMLVSLQVGVVGFLNRLDDYSLASGPQEVLVTRMDSYEFFANAVEAYTCIDVKDWLRVSLVLVKVFLPF
jgi:hypothetical protein